jgi:IS5 family transposase
MRPGKQEWTGEHDLFRARLDQIINMKHELVRLARTIDWSWIDTELAECFSEEGRPGLPTRFMVGLLLLKQIYGLSDEQVCERWVYDLSLPKTRFACSGGGGHQPWAGQRCGQAAR